MKATRRILIILIAALVFVWWLFAWHPSAAHFLEDAVAKGDKGEISRAFLDVIYSGKWKMKEVIPALQSHLSHPIPFVRCHAAQALYTVGDRSGYSTLVALVQTDGPIAGIGHDQDMRVEAARTLAKFRESDAASAISELYGRTNDGVLLEALTKLGSSQAASLIQAKGFRAESSAIKYYAGHGMDQFIPQIASVFQNTPKQELKVAAAWALATMSGDQSAIDYLIQASQPAIRSGTSLQDRSAASHALPALKCLGSIRSPQAKQTLEAALDSPIPAVLEVATVNLLFNQGGSEKAVQVVARQLRETPPSSRWMRWDLTLNIAAQLTDHPEIQAAGQVFAQKSETESWWLYTVERKNWPIYNWIDDCVVRLNR